MATETATQTETSTGPGNVVEMSWDPITRIVGSLGIYTKIDFDRKKVVECHSTSSIFRGIQHFPQEQGSARHAFHHEPHLRHLRRQPCDLLDAMPRIWPMGSGHQTWRSGSSISVRPPSTCSTTTFFRTIWLGWIFAR